jgi:hypothetical protein
MRGEYRTVVRRSASEDCVLPPAMPASWVFHLARPRAGAARRQGGAADR